MINVHHTTFHRDLALADEMNCSVGHPYTTRTVHEQHAEPSIEHSYPIKDTFTSSMDDYLQGNIMNYYMSKCPERL